MKKLKETKVGERVTRNMAGIIMDLRVSEVTDDLIKCGPWEFDRQTGAEIDEDLGWDNNRTGSFITVSEEKKNGSI